LGNSDWVFEALETISGVTHVDVCFWIDSLTEEDTRGFQERRAGHTEDRFLAINAGLEKFVATFA
jgi:hypothetical protein